MLLHVRVCSVYISLQLMIAQCMKSIAESLKRRGTCEYLFILMCELLYAATWFVTVSIHLLKNTEAVRKSCLTACSYRINVDRHTQQLQQPSLCMGTEG